MFRKVTYYARQVRSLIVFKKRVYTFGRVFIGNRRNVTIGDGCSINDGVRILGRESVIIGNNVTLSAGCMLLDSGLAIGSGGREHVGSRIVIEDGVWVGAGAIVLAGVRVGRGAVIGAGSIVTHDIPSQAVAVGNPARVIRTIT